MTRITKVTVAMITMITKISYNNRKKGNNNTGSAILVGLGGGAWPPHFFCAAKRKKRKKGKKERLSKQKLLKDCHQGQNVTVLAILERLEFKHFSGLPTMVVDNTCQCSMVPSLRNPLRRPCNNNDYSTGDYQDRNNK